MLFTDSTKGLMNLKTPIDSKYNSMKAFNKLLLASKLLKKKKTTTETRLKKERIIKNVDELYEKYYNAYKSDYDTDDELNETTRRSLIDAQGLKRRKVALREDENTNTLINIAQENDSNVFELLQN